MHGQLKIYIFYKEFAPLFQCRTDLLRIFLSGKKTGCHRGRSEGEVAVASLSLFIPHSSTWQGNSCLFSIQHLKVCPRPAPGLEENAKDQEALPKELSDVQSPAKKGSGSLYDKAYFGFSLSE